MEVDLKDLRIQHREEDHSNSPDFNLWKLLFFILLLLAATLIYWRETKKEGSQGIDVTTELVRTGSPRSRATKAAFSAAGWVKLPNYHPVYLSPLTAGRLEEVLVIEGDKVQKGQVLARLYAEDYQSQLAAKQAAQAVAKANLDKLSTGYRKQDVAQAQAEVTQFQAEWERARLIAERSGKLQPTGAISLETLQTDEAAANAAQAKFQKAKEKLDLMREGYRTEEIALARANLAKAQAEMELAKSHLRYTEIRSPMTGVILERTASPGQWITPGKDTVVSIYNPADLEARIDVNQGDITKVFLGQTVDILTRAEEGKTFKAKVILIEPKADQVKNIVPTKVKFQAPQKGILLPDMVVQARFRPAEATPEKSTTATPKVLTVPVSAVLGPVGQKYVFVISGGKAHHTPLVLGKIDAGRYPVKSGLQGGERIAITGVEALTDGALVQLHN